MPPKKYTKNGKIEIEEASKISSYIESSKITR
jgi:hypothetical protein